MFAFTVVLFWLMQLLRLAIFLLFVWLLIAFLGAYNIKLGIFLHAICRQKTTEKQIVLTFDDGVDAQKTPQVLDTLARFGAKATFFLIGEKAEQNPEIVQRIAAEGHQIGIHTYRHQNTFPFGTTKKIVADLTKTQAILEKITGTKISLFRPPFGVTNPPIARAVRQLNLTTVGWTIRSYDTNRKMPRQKVVAKIERQLQPGAIVLLHDDRPQSAELLEQILLMLESKNFKVAPLNIC